LERGSGGAPALWASGISGDRPILLVRVAKAAGLDQVRDVLAAQRYWRSKRLGVDVVTLNTGADRLQSQLASLLKTQQAQLDADGGDAGAFALFDSEISDALRAGLATAARIVLDTDKGGLDAAIERASSSEVAPKPESSALSTVRAPLAAKRETTRSPLDTKRETVRSAATEPLEFDNGLGGFAQDGSEYAITLDDDRCTPMPWINVVSNPSFGFIVSAEGGGYTWSINSQQNPLTPWPNDPVSDSPHEIVYLRDEDSGELWSATASPIHVPGVSYVARHGKGYSRFAHTAHGIASELLQYVPVDDSVKVSRLRLRNRSRRARRLTVTGYVEWALGPNGTVPAPFVVSVIDAATGALFARNAWRAEFGERVAFFDMAEMQQSCTADRSEFLGRYGAVDRPAALVRPQPLAGNVGAGLDPCGALQTQFELAPDAEAEIVLLLGDAGSVDEARRLVEKYRTADLNAVLHAARAQWNELLDAVQVHTPDRALDILLNHWLLYQTLGCRVWARSGYYQSSGAYGFRDQLQDVMALTVSAPDLAREHLLRSASRQFVVGDVQHWWLPPGGQGVRTTMTDDRVWLPYVAAHYVNVTGDRALLDEAVAFIAGEKLNEGKHEAFFTPSVTRKKASLYEHCARAIDVSLALGAHKLPLIGTGDWNDGMNRVGEQGRGESVWLAWFLLATIDGFVAFAQVRSDKKRVTRWQKFAADLRSTLEGAGWDGQWYRRGYYDDGTPLGASESSECKIDTIAQSWSVIAGAQDASHAAQAMAAVDEYLIRDDDQLALLFTPPFDRTPMEPGYIKGYPPGIRENGGQYTHGAIWSVFAYAMLGDGDRASSLFTILNPISHSSSPEDVARYQVEPYAACADVYSVAPHVGRGGWTWYTGSAGWLYRAGLEAILGFRLQGDALTIDPCIPKSWPGYEITFRRRGARNVITRYEIAVESPDCVSRGVVRAELDGVKMAQAATSIRLVNDGGTHRVRIVLG
ncbi:MAG: glycosyl transferase family 36, partial [Pseudomonadota bacterium]|nr:glycosyl transferase family 36 [Pseudomonadota bacterium]